MRSFARYITKYLVSFAAFILALLISQWGDIRPDLSKGHGSGLWRFLPAIHAGTGGCRRHAGTIIGRATKTLRQNEIWAIYLNEDGQCYWAVDLPAESAGTLYHPRCGTIYKRVSRGLSGFCLERRGWAAGAGISQRQLYQAHQQLLFHPGASPTPRLCAGHVGIGCVVPLFRLLFFQTQNHSQYRAHCIRGGNAGGWKAVSLQISGELSEIASSVSKASSMLSRQKCGAGELDQRRFPRHPHTALHDYGVCRPHRRKQSRKRGNSGAGGDRAQAKCQDQGVGTRSELVSQLEYEMQPLHKEPVRLSKLLRAYVADRYEYGDPRSLQHLKLRLRLTPNKPCWNATPD